jgi:hypothetical protein
MNVRQLPAGKQEPEFGQHESEARAPESRGAGELKFWQLCAYKKAYV